MNRQVRHQTVCKHVMWGTHFLPAHWEATAKQLSIHASCVKLERRAETGLALLLDTTQ